jgi:hypothetical protein
MHEQNQQDTVTDRRRRRLVPTLAAGLALTLGLAACGDSDDEGAAPTTTEAGQPTTTGTAGGETVEITAVDYAFQGVPDSVEAGTTFTLTNDSEAELHELVAFRLPDDETRSAEELFSDPANLESLGGDEGPPDAVLVAAPGSDMPGPVVGDGSFTEPGRYLMACFIPTGVDPEAYLNAPENPDGPPQVEGADGPPHFTQGMYAEFTVE